MENVSDILANIRYRLRHEAISDTLVEYLSETLDALRRHYLRARHDFRDDDIQFLKRLVVLIPKLEQFLGLDSALQILLKRDRLMQDLGGIQSMVDALNEDSFVVVSKQFDARMKEVIDVMATPAPSPEVTLRDKTAQRL